MRAKTINEINFERGLKPKKAMGIGGFDLHQAYLSTAVAGMKDWEKYLEQFVGKKVSFVVYANRDNPTWAKPGERISIIVHSWGKHWAHPENIWFFDNAKRPMDRIDVNLDGKIYIDDES